MVQLAFVAACVVLGALVIVYSALQRPRKPFLIGSLTAGAIGFVIPILAAVWAVSAHGGEGAVLAYFAPVTAVLGALIGAVIAALATPPTARRIGVAAGAVLGLVVSPFVAAALVHGGRGYDFSAVLMALCSLVGALLISWLGAGYERWGRPVQARMLWLLGGAIALSIIGLAANVGDVRYKTSGAKWLTGLSQTDFLLHTLTKGETPAERYEAAARLSYMATRDPRMLTSLFDAMTADPDPCARQAIARAISMVNDPRVVPMSANLLYHGSRLQRYMAAAVLAQVYGPTGRQTLLGALASRDPETRAAAQWAWGYYRLQPNR